MKNEEEAYNIYLKNKNKIYAILALKGGCCRRDKKGRAYYLVPTDTRRSGQMLIPEKSIKSFLKKGDITQEDIDKIKLY